MSLASPPVVPNEKKDIQVHAMLTYVCTVSVLEYFKSIILDITVATVQSTNDILCIPLTCLDDMM